MLTFWNTVGGGENMPDATKKCRNCQSEIDAKAKKCPHCQSDLRNWFARHPILTGISALIVLISAISTVGGSGGTSKKAENTTAPEATIAPEVTEKLPTVGEAVTDGDLAFTVQGVKTTSTVGSFYSKTAQGQFYIVTVKIENKGNDTKLVDSSQFQVIDSQGRTFDRSIDGQSALGIQQGQVDLFLQQIQPSLSYNGDLVFDLPKDATGLKIVVKGSLFSRGKQIDLGQ